MRDPSKDNRLKIEQGQEESPAQAVQQFRPFFLVSLDNGGGQFPWLVRGPVSFNHGSNINNQQLNSRMSLG